MIFQKASLKPSAAAPATGVSGDAWKRLLSPYNDVSGPAGRREIPGIDVGRHLKKIKISKFSTQKSTFSDFCSAQVGLVGHPPLSG